MSSLLVSSAAAEADGAPPITADGVPRAALGIAERRALYDLLCTYFDGVTPEQFAHDLDEKDWVLRLHRGGRLVGFSTLCRYGTEFDGTAANIIYSGDTITEPEVWSSPVLSRAWIALVRRIQGDRASEPWYWLLLSSGFRTYRFLPVFWREFWPRRDAATPDRIAAFMNRLARERFGTRFDERSGIVRFERPQRLRSVVAAIPDGKRRDPHVDFFLARNPHHDRGDELVCFADLSDANLTAAGVRMLRGSAARR